MTSLTTARADLERTLKRHPFSDPETQRRAETMVANMKEFEASTSPALRRFIAEDLEVLAEKIGRQG